MGALDRFVTGTVFFVLLTRASLDVVLDLAQLDSEGGGMGIGAFINLLLVCSAAYLVVARYDASRVLELAPWALLLLLCLATSLSSPDQMRSFRSLFVLLSYPCAYAIGISLAKTEDRARLLRLVLYSSAVPIAVGLYQLAAGIEFDEGRIAGPFAHPNVFAFYLMIVIAVALNYPKRPEGRWRFALTAVRLLHLALLLALLVLTKTRGAWIGVAMIACFYAVLVDRRALLGLAAGPVVALFVPAISDRIFDVGTETEYIGQGVIMNSFEWRKALWGYAAEWIWQRPLSGHGGLESFSYYSPMFFPLEEKPFNAHSVYVQLAFETGLLGPALFGTILIALAWRFGRMLWKGERYGALGISMCVAYASICYSDNVLHYLVVNWYFWFTLGCVAMGPGVQSFALAANEVGSRPYAGPEINRATPALSRSRCALTGKLVQRAPEPRFSQ